MDTVNYEIVKQINRELLNTQEQNVQIHKRNKEILEKLDELNNLNFKFIGIALGAGLLLGVLFVSGYSYFKFKEFQKQIAILQSKVLPDEYYLLNSEDNKIYIYIKQDDSRFSYDEKSDTIYISLTK